MGLRIIETNEITVDYLTATGKMLKVYVSSTDDYVLPRFSDLAINEFAPDSAEYQDAYAKVVEKKKAEDLNFDEETFGFTALDITLYDADGNEFEPDGSVKVTIEVVDLPADNNVLVDTMEIQHLEEKEDGSIEVKTVATSENVEDIEGVVTADFDVDSFSTFVITWEGSGTVSSNATTLNLQVNENTYATINVYYVDKNGTPIERPTTVTETVSGESTFVISADNIAKAIAGAEYQGTYYSSYNGESLSSITVDRDSSDAPGVVYDSLGEAREGRINNQISPPAGYSNFYSDANGNTEIFWTEGNNGRGRFYTRANTTNERYRYNGSVYGARNATITSYTHTITFDNEEIVPLTYTSTSAVWENAASIFLVYSKESANQSTVHYGYMNGDNFVEFSQEELPPSPVEIVSSGNSHYSYLIYDFKNYHYADETYYHTSETDTPRTGGTQTQPLIRWTNSGQSWTYTSSGDLHTFHEYNDQSNIENGSHIYVIYEKNPDITPGGTPTVKPVSSSEPPIEPTILKTSTPNTDGTNTLSLSITGDTSPLEVEKLADVIVVFDASSSMQGDMSGRGNQPEANRRITLAKNATNALAESLLAKKNSDGQPLIRMALIPFSMTASVHSFGESNYTSDYSTYEAAVNGISTSTGTNWEHALLLANQLELDSGRATFVIFVTDGEPSMRVTRGNFTDAQISSERGSAAQYLAQTTFYGGLSASNENNYTYAVPAAKSIVDANKNFYSIGISSDVTTLESLTTASGAGDDHCKTATTEEELVQAFEDIEASIIALLGWGDINMTDGITNLSNTVAKSGLVEVDGNFEYWKASAPEEWDNWTKAVKEAYIKGTSATSADNPEGWDSWSNEQKAAYNQGKSATYVAWDPSSENCDEASYNSSTGSVEWNMGHNFMPEAGCSYKVTFKVWPSQTAYDILAKCKNDPTYYDKLSDAERAQIERTGTSPNFTYRLKTNDKNPRTTYKEARKTNEGITTSGDEKTIYFNEVDSMNLVEDRVSIAKTWNNQVDSTRPHDITLQLYGNENGTKVLYKSFTLNSGNNWTASDGYISCGMMAVDESSGRVIIYESGHDFTLAETGEGSYYWDLKAPTYHPMVINNTRTTLILVEGSDIPSGMGSSDFYNDSGTKYYRIGNGVYKYHSDASDGIHLTAINNHRTYVDLSKVVTGVENSTEEFRFKIKLTDSMGEGNGNSGYLFFTVRDVAGRVNLDNTVVTTSAEFYPIGGAPYFRVASDSEFTLDIRQGWNVRFLNLPGGSTYVIEELNKENYEFVSISAAAMIGGESTPIDVTITEAEKKIEGTVDQSNAGHTIQYTNKAITRQVTLLKTTETGKSSPLGGAQFDLYTKVGYESNPKQAPIKTGIESSTLEASKGLMDLGVLAVGDYYLVETKAPDGYNLLDTAVTLHVEQEKISIIQGSSQRQDITPDDKEYDAFITNTSGVELPNTGGPGTHIYTLSGLILLTGSVIGLSMRRRERRWN